VVKIGDVRSFVHAIFLRETRKRFVTVAATVNELIPPPMPGMSRLVRVMPRNDHNGIGFARLDPARQGRHQLRIRLGRPSRARRSDHRRQARLRGGVGGREPYGDHVQNRPPGKSRQRNHAGPWVAAGGRCGRERPSAAGLLYSAIAFLKRLGCATRRQWLDFHNHAFPARPANSLEVPHGRAVRRCPMARSTISFRSRSYASSFFAPHPFG